MRSMAERAGRTEPIRIIMGTTQIDVTPDDVVAYGEAGVDELLIPYLRQSYKWLDHFLDGLRPFMDAAA